MAKFPVKLYVYDLSRGMARQLSPFILGKQIDGIWHTGLVCYDREFFYGGDGINSCLPGGTILGSPDEVVDLGDTEITQDLFIDFLSAVGQEDFRGENYNLFEHNCNTFSSEVAMFLTGNKIPQHIRDLPSEVLNSSFGQMIRPMIDSVSVRPSGGTSISPTPSTSTSRAPESIFEPRNGPPGKTKQREPPDGCQGAISRNPNVYKDVKGPLLISDLRECLKRMELSDEDLIYLDELKRCFEAENLSKVNESQIQKLDQLIDKYLTEEGSQALHLTLKLLQLLSQCEKLFSSSKVLQCYQPSVWSLLLAWQLENLGFGQLVTSVYDLCIATCFSVIHKDIECSTAIIELLNRNVSPETVSHTLPASGIHLRPTLDSSAGHKSLKHNSSAGPDALYHPPSDYMELDNKAEVNSLSSMNTPGLSGPIDNSSAAVEARSPLIPPPPPSFSALGKSEKKKTKSPGNEVEPNGQILTEDSPDVSHL